MKHYSIQAVDIYIHELTATKGWHYGDTIHYQIKNCAWESHVELQLIPNSFGFYELHGKQIFENGDQEKMHKDQAVTLMALQAHISRHNQERRQIHWLEEQS